MITAESFVLQWFLHTDFKGHGAFSSSHKRLSTGQRAHYRGHLDQQLTTFPIAHVHPVSITKWAWLEEIVNKPRQSSVMKQRHHAKSGLQSPSVCSKHRCLLSDTRHLRVKPGPGFTCRRVIQDRVWHMAPFTGRNLINHSHYLSILCTWAHFPSAQNQQSVA